MPITVSTPDASAPAGRLLPAVLLLLTVFGPISMDLYLPLLPALTLDLSATTSMAQLTVTACLVGLALGQLVAGPLSDRFGRRGPLLIGVIGYVVMSAWCAIAPSVELLIGARLLQGVAGGVGLVIAQAAGRDLYSGGALIRYFGRLTVLSGLAAIVGPLVGGLLATVTDWRGLFLFLTAIGVAILLAVFFAFAETLPRDRRVSGGFAHTADGYRTLLRDRRFVGAVLVSGFVSAALGIVIASLLVMVSGVAVTTPPTTTIALAGYPRMAGTASSLLGMARFAFGGAAAPLVGIAGAGTMLPLGIVTVAGIALAAASVALLAPRRHTTGADSIDIHPTAADALATTAADR